MLLAVVFFFFGLAMVAKVKIWPSVTSIIITCRSKMAVSAEMPSVATRFSPSIFLSHVTPPPNSILALCHYLSIILSKVKRQGRIGAWNYSEAIAKYLNGLLYCSSLSLGAHKLGQGFSSKNRLFPISLKGWVG